MTLGPALCVYLGAWAGLALLRALTIRRGWQWDWRPPRGRFKLAFTGWALVCEWWVPSGLNRSRSTLLPTAGARRRRKQSFDGGGGGWRGDGGDGPTLGVLLFWLGQAAVVLFLAWNALVTLRDSRFIGGAADDAATTDGGHHGRRLLLGAAGVRGTLHVASRMRPMAFLLPSSASTAVGGAGEATADWRFVWWAALLALAVHEYGHARAARREGVQVQHAGVYLAVLLPGAYVLIPDSIKDVSAWARLRVLVAGVAANATLCLLVALLAGLPACLLTLPEPGGGAVIRSLPPDSPLVAALKPGNAIAALQDVPIVDGAAEMASLLKTHAEVTAARSSALLRAVAAAMDVGGGKEEEEEQQQHEKGASFSLAALNATVAGLLAEARLSHLEAAGLLPPEAFCTHLNLTEGEDDEDRPSCCTFDALVGRSHHQQQQQQQQQPGSVSVTSSTDSRTSCFAYLRDSERLHLTCLPVELALHAHVVGLGPAGSVGARGGRGQCFRPVSTPPNVLLKIALAHGSVVIFEGHVGHVFAAAGLADTQPRAWVRALLPEEWAMALDTCLIKFCAALVDVSFSLGVLNLVPLYQLDGAHALHEAALLLVRRLPPANGPGRHKLLTWYRGGVLAVGVIFGLNVFLAGLAAME